MGNWNPQKSKADLDAAWRGLSDTDHDKLDKKLPFIEKPCGTPGAVYTIVAKGNEIGCLVELPFQIEDALPPSAVEVLKKQLHDAMLPLVEAYYKTVWDSVLSGKVIGDDPEPLPYFYHQLFHQYEKRQAERNDA